MKNLWAREEKMGVNFLKKGRLEVKNAPEGEIFDPKVEKNE